jgi:hypothetical protein
MREYRGFEYGDTIAYLTCIIPISIARLIGLQEETVPQAVWILGMSFLFFLGKRC